MTIPEILLSWYEQNKRDLPWRSTRDPYRIWLSEVILQQTRVNQGLEYYHRFLERFPDINSLAAADEEEVLKLWQGLGYYSRARNMHHTAHTIVNQYSGIFPGTYDGLIHLKGIGPYTAAAIASLSFGEAVPVVDGNVARLLSRLFAFGQEVNTSSGLAALKGIAAELLGDHDPAVFNQAVMEFGALVCRPLNPDCAECPLQLHCAAFHSGNVSKFPIKKAGQPAKEVYYHYLVITFIVSGIRYVVIRKRDNQGIWKNLYDFPLVEADHLLDFPEILIKGGWTYPDHSAKLSVSAPYLHQLSHRRIIAAFYRIETKGPELFDSSWIKVSVADLDKYPVPRLIDRYLSDGGLEA